jgi:uncharacterized RDD family membrane protein YckC
MEAAPHCTNHYDTFEDLRHCNRCGRVFCPDCMVQLQGQPFCGSCKNEVLLDVQSGVGPLAGLSLTTILRRFGAYVIDLIVVGLPNGMIGAGLQLGMMFYGFKSIWLLFTVRTLVGITLGIVYEGLMLQKRAQTVGKIAVQARVVRPDGSPISAQQAWTRAVARQLLSVLIIVDYLPAFFTAERTTLHDMIAGTRVVNVS